MEAFLQNCTASSSASQRLPRQVLAEMLANNAERARRKGDVLSIECYLPEELAHGSGERMPCARDEATTWHILVAENTPGYARLLETMLIKLGYRVSLVNNGQRAVDWVKHRALPDLILMDYHMPVVDGLEAIRLIRAWERQNARPLAVPIVAMSTGFFEHERGQCLTAGANDFLSKPFQLSTLKILLDSLLHGIEPATAHETSAPSAHSPHSFHLHHSPHSPPPINFPLALDRMGGDLEIFMNFAASLPAQMLQDHAAISEIALAAGSVGWSEPTPAAMAADAKLLRKVSHRLRGVCGMLGAERAQAACAALEVAARQCDGAAYPARIQELEAALAVLMPALDDFLAHPAGHLAGPVPGTLHDPL